MNNVVKTVEIVSLSAGTIGEDFVKHEVEPGIQRLKDMGLEVIFSENAMKGRKFISKHPEKRAEDLINAFKNPCVDMILCAIGGEDTYRLLPYLFDNDELKKALCNKIFLGFSDSTMNHFMLNKVGLKTFYGQSFLADICEMDKEMLPYTKKFFLELIKTGKIAKITPSDTWYDGRTDYSVEALGTPLKSHKNEGFKVIQGDSKFSGEILGGCLDTIYDIFDGERFADSPDVCAKYELFPSAEEWNGKILLLETSEEQMSPEKFERGITYLKNTGIFARISGILMGKPMDNVYHEEYIDTIVRVIDNPSLPILANLSIGHALPRCIIPFGVEAFVDGEKQEITFANQMKLV